jgi:hypothetical protein
VDFFEFYAGLAPEGETALLLRQKPVRPAAVHADGSPKCTFIPMLPTAPRDPSWSLYGNTGSFIVARFPDGRPVAQSACVEYPLLLVLDDCGTDKAPMPTVPPTWLIESSPGSYQAAYVFDVDGVPTKEQFITLVRALAAKGLTDPGAGGIVRNFRVPGSVNLKPGRDGFAARLVEFEPARAFTYAALCAAFDVPPSAAGARAGAWQPQRALADDGGDDVWAWLGAEGLIISRPNAEGWAGVVCPNAEAHTDGNPEGRYSPSLRSYCCLHGHCVDFHSREFLAWVASAGGPEREPGLRDELLAITMASALARLPAGTVEAESAAEALADVREREHGRIERGELHRRWAYVVADDGYFNLDDRTEISRRAFNALYGHIECRSPHGKRALISASTWFDAYRQPMDGRALAGITYAPGAPVLVERGGEAYGNRWVDARCGRVTGAVAAGPWLAHAETVLPDVRELEHLLDILAFKLQHPSVKINCGVLLAGVAGCGKDSLIAPFLRAVCGPSQLNRGLVQNDELSATWGYHLECEVLILNELKDPNGEARRALANKLKPLLAAPPEYLSINRKGLRPYDALNRLLAIAYSNEQVPLAIDSSDRRWFALRSPAQRMDPAAAASLWGWYEHGGGYAAVGEYLWTRDVSAFMPGAAPPNTAYRQTLVIEGRSTAEEILVDLIETRAPPFTRGVICGPFAELCASVQAQGAAGARIPKAALLHALAECGWIDCGVIHSRDFPTKRQVYCAPELADESKSDLRRIAETKSGGDAFAGLRIV